MLKPLNTCAVACSFICNIFYLSVHSFFYLFHLNTSFYFFCSFTSLYFFIIKGFFLSDPSVFVQCFIVGCIFFFYQVPFFIRCIFRCPWSRAERARCNDVVLPVCSAVHLQWVNIPRHWHTRTRLRVLKRFDISFTNGGLCWGQYILCDSAKQRQIRQ